MADTHALLLVPTAPGVGLTSASLGLLRALERHGLRVGFLKPIRQPGSQPSEGADVRGGGRGQQLVDRASSSPSGDDERSTTFVRNTTTIDPPEPMAFRHAQTLIAEGRRSELLQAVVGMYQQAATNNDVVVVEGLAATSDHPGLDTLNAQIANAIDAEVILVAAVEGGLSLFSDSVSQAAEPFGGVDDPQVLGVIANKLNAPRMDVIGTTRTELRRPATRLDAEAVVAGAAVLANHEFALLGAVPFDPLMVSPRTLDVAQHLGATVLSEGELRTRRVVDVSLVARSVGNMTHRLRPDALMVTPADRDDVILAVCMAALNGVPLAGLVLTGDLVPNPRVLELCAKAFETGLPLLSVTSDSYVTSARAAAMNLEVPIDDVERIERVMERVAEHLMLDHLVQRIAAEREPRMSPPAFLYRLVERARAADRRIVLPEGTEPRTVLAAAACAERGIARCVLIGNVTEVERVALAQGVELGERLEVIEPSDELRERYVADMVALRSHKGLTPDGARNQLRDDVVLGTMMLARGEVDGLVAGAINTTAHTVRPALQLIKTRKDAMLVSSVFFMCLPDQVLVFGDCAVNPDPNPEELADIAVQSADSALAFGIPARVALISYSTGSSGEGDDVEKVRTATRLAKERRPELIIEGPLQYDAATVPSVARSKAPQSVIAGRATVLVFPDLNTGNSTYKAVQRAAGVVSIGPMLQGLRRPVNDLSRGASVDDIVYTIALTAIQAAS